MAVQTTNNKPINPRGNDQSPKGYNRAALYSGKALDFDGVNDSVNCGDFMTDNADFSVSFYLKINTWTNNKGVISTWDNSYNGFAIALHSTGLKSWANDGASGGMVIVTQEELGTTEYHHIVLTYDYSTGTQKGYFNGHYTNQEVFVDTMTHSDFQIGYGNFGYTYSDVNVAGVKVFNEVLTAAQVSDLYNNPEKIVPTGVADSALKLYLPMMEGAGTTAYDGSGGGNHGTISGATWTHGIGAPVAQTAVIDWNKKENLIIKSESIVENQVPGGWGQGSGDPLESSSEADPTGRNTASLINVAGQSNSEYFYNYQTPVTSGETYTFSIWTKLGTADNVVFVLNDTSAWNSMSGANYVATAANGYDEWKQVSITFTAPSTNKINAHIGYHQETGVAAQDNGTFYIWGAALHKGSTPILVPTFGTAQSSEVLLPQGLTSGRDITGVNLFENVRKQGALNLDGNSWAEVHDNASLDITAFSVEAWAYPIQAATSAGEEIFGKYYGSSQPYNSYGIEWLTDRFRINYGDTSNVFNVVTAGSSQALNNWHHIVGTYDGANFKIYINGSESNSVAKTSSVITGDGPVYIGTWGGAIGSATQTFDGPIAQPRIYNRALTAEEVERNYNAGKNIYK